MKSCIYLFLLLFFCSCYKFEWNNPNDPIFNSSVQAVSIGDSYNGGIVVYIFQSGDMGYDTRVQHGIIAAREDQSELPPLKGVFWQLGTYDPPNQTTIFDLTSANQVAVGTGKVNTNKILDVQTRTGRSFAAVNLCVNYNGGGYKDWFLPSKDELLKVYQARDYLSGFVYSASELIYWSSTEKNIAYAEAIDFKTGIPLGIGGYKGPGTGYRVRAIRYF